MEKVHDSAFRFFPAQRDELFGYVLQFGEEARRRAVLTKR